MDLNLNLITKVSESIYRVEKGFVPNMRIPAQFYANDVLSPLLLEELEHYSSSKGVGGFLPAVLQMANVAALPGVVGVKLRS